jgi:DNA-directed RNA polymerase alpha subunit
MKLREITLLCNHKLGPRLEYSLFRISPFMKGQALTVASTLRRILLNELSAVKITTVSIEEPSPINHEFSILSGFKESLPEILNNLRQIIFRLSLNEKHSLEKDLVNSTVKPQKNKDIVKEGNFLIENSKSLYTTQAILEYSGKGIITSKNIKFPFENNKSLLIDVVDPRQYIATGVSPYAKLHINLEITQSKRYITCIDESYSKRNNFQAVIPVNPSFNPVKRVNYIIKQNSTFTYEFILFEVWTDRSISPTEALAHSSVAAKQLFQPFL